MDDRSRNWVFVGYPESLPDNWIDILVESMVSFCVSPLHDRDIDPDGRKKKPHWHIILSFGSNKSFNQVKEITNLLGQPIPQVCRNVKGYVRYLVHKDNPDKAQYDENQIQCFNGFDLSAYLKCSSTDRYLAIKEMIEVIRDSEIYEYSVFVMWCMDNRFEWFKLLCDNSSYIIKEFIDSFRYAKKCK
jgi:hypothetical protein